MTDDSFPPFPFAKLDENAPPMPKEKKAKKVISTNGRRKKKGIRRGRKARAETYAPPVTISNALAEKIIREGGVKEDLITVSVDDIKFINGVLQSMQAFPRPQQKRIIIALSKVFG